MTGGNLLKILRYGDRRQYLHLHSLGIGLASIKHHRALANMFYASLLDKDRKTPYGPLNLASRYPRNGTVNPDLGELGGIPDSSFFCGLEGPKTYAGTVSLIDWVPIPSLTLIIGRLMPILNFIWSIQMP